VLRTGSASMRSCNNWRGKVCSRDHAIRVLIGPRISGVNRQRLIHYWLTHPTEMWKAYATRIRCRTQQRTALLAKG
jgi:hypothetical protein